MACDNQFWFTNNNIDCNEVLRYPSQLPYISWQPPPPRGDFIIALEVISNGTQYIRLHTQCDSLLFRKMQMHVLVVRMEYTSSCPFELPVIEVNVKKTWFSLMYGSFWICLHTCDIDHINNYYHGIRLLNRPNAICIHVYRFRQSGGNLRYFRSLDLLFNITDAKCSLNDDHCCIL